MSKCINCKYYKQHFCGRLCVDVMRPETGVKCDLYVPLTNAEYIKHMSDDVLADFLSRISGCSTCPIKNSCDVNKHCDDMWREYLAQPREA